jgi:hypothetical protein
MPGNNLTAFPSIQKADVSENQLRLVRTLHQNPDIS